MKEVNKELLKKDREMQKYVVPKWHSFAITAATIIIAFSAIVNTCQSKKTLEQIQTQTALIDTTIALQAKYFATVNRPFVFIDSAFIKFKFTEKDTFIDFWYYIKNVGTQPAKINFTTSGISNSVDTTFTFQKIGKPAVSVLFPNQSELKFRGKFISIKSFRENPYLLFFIEYEDFGGETYHYKTIEHYNAINPVLIKTKGTLVWTQAN